MRHQPDSPVHHLHRRERTYLVVTKHPDGSATVSAPLERMQTMAPTLGEAYYEMTQALRARRHAFRVHRQLLGMSSVAFDPRVGHYVARCEAAGITATGFTRQSAWARLLHGLELKADELALGAEETELEQEDEVRGGPVGLHCGGDPGDPDVSGGSSDPEAGSAR